MRLPFVSTAFVSFAAFTLALPGGVRAGDPLAEAPGGILAVPVAKPEASGDAGKKEEKAVKGSRETQAERVEAKVKAADAALLSDLEKKKPEAMGKPAVQEKAPAGREEKGGARREEKAGKAEKGGDQGAGGRGSGGGEVRGGGGSFGATPRRRSIEGKLTLDEAVGVAVRQNPDVLRGVRELERVRGQIVEVRAQGLPHVGVVTSFNNQDPRLLVGNWGNMVQQSSWQISIEGRQLLYSGGQVSAAIAGARHSQDLAYYNLRDVLDRTVSDVRKQFAQVLVTADLIDVAEESVTLADRQLLDARNRFEAGTVPRFNVLRAEVELASVKPALIRARNDHLIAQLQLARTLGLDPTPGGKPSFECAGELLVVDQPLGLSDALNLGRARRPLLKARREQMLVEKERVKGAWAGFHPRVEARGGFEVRNNFASKHLDDTLHGYFLGVTGRWNLFDSLETMGQVSQAKARFSDATIGYEDAVLQVELEIQRAFSDLAQHKETIESQQKNVEQALEALRLAQERLAAGAGTQLEVLDARVALTRARNTELQAMGDYARTLAEFERATGATTEYSELFKDPLEAVERKILGRKPAGK
jgi:outer membrane protein TolC